MTNYQNLGKTVRTYLGLLAMFGLAPFAVLCVVVVLPSHGTPYFQENAPLIIGTGICSLLAFSGMMALSRRYLSEIIGLVNDCWVDSIENELKPNLLKTLDEMLGTVAAEKRMRDQLARKYIASCLADIDESRKEIQKLAGNVKALAEKIGRMAENEKPKILTK